MISRYAKQLQKALSECESENKRLRINASALAKAHCRDRLLVKRFRKALEKIIDYDSCADQCAVLMQDISRQALSDVPPGEKEDA